MSRHFTAEALFGPPGTGKTTDILRLVGEARNEGYAASDIGFFSFTKAAAGEALKRLGITRSDKISTLHSLAFRAAGASPMQMVDGYKLRKFGRAAGIEFSGAQSDEYGEQMEDGDKYLAIYGLARSRLTDPRTEYYASERPGDFARFEHCIESYESWKKAYGFLDFTDLIEMYVRNPRNHGARVLFIDEAQDLSPLQWQMLDRMVAFAEVERVTIAGDDDQAIYEWAGADPHGMTKFLERYDGQSRVLAQSYRVPQAVHDVARSVVQTIRTRVQKRYRAAPRPGQVVRYGSGFEAASVAHGDDVLILCRSHTQKKETEEALVASRVPYRVEGGKPGLFDSVWANGIRTLRKLEAGGEISPTELETLTKTATNAGKAALNTRDFKKLLQLGPERAIAIPAHLVEFFRDADLSQTPTIRVSTIHASKGREARHVVLNTGITARTENAIDTDPDAEARVWYVGVTRAKERLDIVSGFDRSYTL